MSVKYCLPIIKQHKETVLDDIANAQPGYDYFEIWLDYIEEMDEAFIRTLCEQYPHRVLFLFRRQWLEPMQMPFEMQSKLLHVLSQLPAFVDLDISQREAFEYLRTNNISLQLVASYHNYQDTPSAEELRRIAEELCALKPEVVKLATFCHSEEDALRLLELGLSLRRQECRYTVLGMGVHGAVTRVFGTLWGNEFAFAPQSDDETSAPGQLTRLQLENIFHSLGT